MRHFIARFINKIKLMCITIKCADNVLTFYNSLLEKEKFKCINYSICF